MQDLEAKTGTVVFVSEGNENIPPGYRARETYIFNGPNEVGEAVGVPAEAWQGVRGVLGRETQASEIARPLRPKSARDRQLNRTDVEREGLNGAMVTVTPYSRLGRSKHYRRPNRMMNAPAMQTRAPGVASVWRCTLRHGR